jgi:hypothetical protein
MTSWDRNLLPRLRSWPAPPPSPVLVFPSRANNWRSSSEGGPHLLEWWTALCAELRQWLPSDPRDLDAAERWTKEVIPAVKGRWPASLWSSLPWLTQDLDLLWDQLFADYQRGSFKEGGELDPLQADFPLPPSLLLGGVPSFLDPFGPDYGGKPGTGEGLSCLSDNRGHRRHLYSWPPAPPYGYGKEPDTTRFWRPALSKQDEPDFNNHSLDCWGANLDPLALNSWDDLWRRWVLMEILRGGWDRGRVHFAAPSSCPGLLQWTGAGLFEPGFLSKQRPEELEIQTRGGDYPAIAKVMEGMARWPSWLRLSVSHLQREGGELDLFPLLILAYEHIPVKHPRGRAEYHSRPAFPYPHFAVYGGGSR